jgi:hypothetical protein
MANNGLEFTNAGLPAASSPRALNNLEEEQFTSKSPRRDEVLEVQDAQSGHVAKDVFYL